MTTYAGLNKLAVEHLMCALSPSKDYAVVSYLLVIKPITYLMCSEFNVIITYNIER